MFIDKPPHHTGHGDAPPPKRQTTPPVIPVPVPAPAEGDAK